MTNTTLSEVLRGCAASGIQTVGAMQIIPLVADAIDVFGDTRGVKVSTTAYGTLVFSMSSDAGRPAIVPKDSMYLTKAGSQDHAIPKVVIISPGESQSHGDAACIEASQGGYMRAEEREMLLLPLPIREEAHRSRGVRSYGKLWDEISVFNREMGVRGGGGHVNAFLRSYASQLDQFVAEFEPIPEQVGAILMIGGQVVGVERFPSHDYWEYAWQTIVRECYGSYALLVTRKGLVNTVPGTRRPLVEGAYPGSVEELQAMLEEAKEAEYAAVGSVVEGLLVEPITVKETAGWQGGWMIETLESTQFVGQTVRNEAGLVVYASLVATKNRLAAPYTATKPFTM